MRNASRRLPPSFSFPLIVEYEARALTRSSFEMLSQIVISPATYLLLLGAGISGLMAGATGHADFRSALAFLIPGVLVFHALGALYRMVWRFYVDRNWGLMALKFLYGVGPFAYAAGFIAVPALFYLAQGAVVLLCAVLFGITFTMAELVALALGGVIATIAWASLGGVLVFTVKQHENRGVIVSLLSLQLAFAAPTFYPLEAMPSYMRAIAVANPITYQVEMMRLGDGFPLTLSIAVSVGLALGLFLALVFLVSRAEPLPGQR